VPPPVRREAEPRLDDPGGAERPRAGSALVGGADERDGAPPALDGALDRDGGAVAPDVPPVRGCARGEATGARPAGRADEDDRDGALRPTDDDGGVDGEPKTRERAGGAVARPAL